MAFIDKLEYSEPIIAIKFTNEGRKLLSEGNLNTLYYALGDSEINYNYLENTNKTGDSLSILKPVDKNPNILSFVKKGSSGGNLYSINSILSEEINVKNTQKPIGFFIYSGNSVTINPVNPFVRTTNVYTTSEDLSITGNTVLKLYSPDFNEIKIGDILILKVLNASNSTTTGNTISQTIPHLKYKITNVISGITDNFVVVDRYLPNLNGIVNTTLGVFILKAESFVNESIEYDDQDIDNATFSNYICGMEHFPFWKMSIIFTEEVIGVSLTNKKYDSFKTAQYAGFLSYIQSQHIKYKKLGVIHYTNSSPLNSYGESLFDNTPILSIPTIMWHKSSGNTIGVKFYADTDEKYVNDFENAINTRYHDLIDNVGNVVGKVFNDLKIFVIEDQDLLFALSYKSNRSWTLPNFNVEIVGSIGVCATCEILIKNVVYTQPQGSNNYGVLIFDVDYLSPEANGDVIVEAFSGGTSLSGGTSVYIKRLSPDVISGKYVLNVPVGTYSRFEIRDIGVSDCVGYVEGLNVIMNTPTPTPTPTQTPTPTPTPLPVVKYTLYIENTNISGGTTNPVHNQFYEYASGTTVNINAIPNQNHEFGGWFKLVNGNYVYYDGSKFVTSTSVVMNSNIRMKPVFNYIGLQVPTVTITLQDTGSYYSTNSLIAYSNVTSDGGSSVGARGICWSTTNPNPMIGDSGTTYTNIGSGLGAMTTEVIGLSANTTYYLRAYAENSAGTGYSSVVTGTTDSITTLPPTISGTTVIIQNNVNDLQIANILIDNDPLELIDDSYPILSGTTVYGLDPVSGYHKYVTIVLMDANSGGNYTISINGSNNVPQIMQYVQNTQVYIFENPVYFDKDMGNVTISID